MLFDGGLGYNPNHGTLCIMFRSAIEFQFLPKMARRVVFVCLLS